MRCFTATYKYELCPTNFSLLVLTMSPDKSVQKEPWPVCSGLGLCLPRYNRTRGTRTEDRIHRTM